MSRQYITNGVDNSEIIAVLQIAEDLINRNKFIEMEKLYRIVKRELNYTSQNAHLILKKLFNEGHILDGSKLIRQELLRNPYRALIYKFIKEHPGVNFSTIRKCAFSKGNKKIKSLLDSKSTDLGSSGQFVWHMEVLLKFKCIKKVEFGNFSLFIPHDMDEQVAKCYFLLRDNINRKIFTKVLEEGIIKQSIIPKFIDKARGTVYYHIKVLIEANLLAPEKINNSIHLKINTDKKREIEKIKDNIELELSKLKEMYKSYPKKSEVKIVTQTEEIEDDIKTGDDSKEIVENKPDIKSKPKVIKEKKQPKEKNERKRLKTL